MAATKEVFVFISFGDLLNGESVNDICQAKCGDASESSRLACRVVAGATNLARSKKSAYAKATARQSPLPPDGACVDWR